MKIRGRERERESEWSERNHEFVCVSFDGQAKKKVTILITLHLDIRTIIETASIELFSSKNLQDETFQ